MALALRTPYPSAPALALPGPKPSGGPKRGHLVLLSKAPPRPPERKLLGIAAILACCALFPVSDTAAKLLTATLPPLEVAWLRYLVFVIVTAPMLLRARGAMLATRRLALHAGRACAATLSTVLAIVSFSLLPVPDATAIGFVAPIIVTGMAAFLLKERVAPRRWAAAVVGLAGVLVIVRPGTGAFVLASLIPLLASFASATSSIATRLVRHERADTTLFYAAAIGFALLSIPVAFVWRTPTWGDAGIGAVVGIFAALASLAQVFAYRHAPASLLQPFTYSQLLWASGLGFLVFGALPGIATALGAAIIAASGLAAAWSEARETRDAKNARHAPRAWLPRHVVRPGAA